MIHHLSLNLVVINAICLFYVVLSHRRQLAPNLSILAGSLGGKPVVASDRWFQQPGLGTVTAPYSATNSFFHPGHHTHLSNLTTDLSIFVFTYLSIVTSCNGTNGANLVGIPFLDLRFEPLLHDGLFDSILLMLVTSTGPH